MTLDIQQIGGMPNKDSEDVNVDLSSIDKEVTEIVIPAKETPSTVKEEEID